MWKPIAGRKSLQENSIRFFLILVFPAGCYSSRDCAEQAIPLLQLPHAAPLRDNIATVPSAAFACLLFRLIE